MTFFKSSRYVKIIEEILKGMVPIPLSVCVGLLLIWQKTQLGRLVEFRGLMGIRKQGGSSCCFTFPERVLSSCNDLKDEMKMTTTIK